MAFRAQFQVLILALPMAVHISSTPYFSLVHALVQDLLLQSLRKVMAHFEDVERCSVQCIYIRKEKIKHFLTGLFSLSHFLQFSFVRFWFC